MFAVFLDIKRAHKITWKHGIPMILYYIGLRIHPTFMQSFLADRKFTVQVGNNLFITVALNNTV